MASLIDIYKTIDTQNDLLTEEIVETPLDFENVDLFEMDQVELDEYFYKQQRENEL